MKIEALFILLLTSMMLCGQELAPIITYSPSDYKADNQNWMISQDDSNIIYVANNKGLLTYNGSDWTTYPSPNNTLMRSVKVINEKIYTGCYEEFGYWDLNEMGKLEYFSLISKLTPEDRKLLDDQNIWNIIAYDEWVLFQSAHALFFYDETNESFKIIKSNKIIYKVFILENHIYYHVAEEGIYKIMDGQPDLVIEDDVVKEDRVINMCIIDSKVLIVMRKRGLYFLEDNQLEQWQAPNHNDLVKSSIFSSIQLSDGGILLGTISNGLYKISSTGDIEYMLNQKNGLGNNTVLCLYEDNAHDIWAGLDNGLNFINTTSPIETFIDYNGILGTVYTSIVYNDYLYVGTNQGLFYKPLKSKSRKFEFIEGTSGQVWKLYDDKNGNLFCGHHLGTLLIKKNTAQLISSTLGTWDIKKVPNNDNTLLQGNYSGIYVLHFSNNKWSIKNKLRGFDNSARHFEITDDYKVLVNHEYEGVYSMTTNSDLLEVSNIKLHDELTLSKNSCLAKYKDHVYYSSNKGIFVYKESIDSFEKDATYSDLIDLDKYVSGKMEVDKSGLLWMFSQNNVSYVKNDALTNTPEIVHIPISPLMRSGVLGFENIHSYTDDKYILGTTNGYLTLDLSKINDETDYQIYLSDINFQAPNEDIDQLILNEYKEFEYKKGKITFNYSVPVFDKFLDVSYQYRLLGQHKDWSDFKQESRVQFENLPFGSYTFEVRAKVGNQITKNIEKYEFKIRRPWYISNIALIAYFISLLFLGYLINKFYKYYFSKKIKHEQITNEKALIQIQNEKLNQEIESKIRELAISTMSIIKKNELLAKIKKEIKKSVNLEEVNNAIDLIDTNLNNNKDWKFFKQAFNNADKDFLDKIKAAHPELTPNDLKFCAYLRLNLSSKEIAPLLNISTKSVETKRYRLRKRLKLNHNDSLVNYILEF